MALGLGKNVWQISTSEAYWDRAVLSHVLTTVLWGVMPQHEDIHQVAYTPFTID